MMLIAFAVALPTTGYGNGAASKDTSVNINPSDLEQNIQVGTGGVTLNVHVPLDEDKYEPNRQDSDDNTQAERRYSCEYYSNRALELVMDGNSQNWEIYLANQICSYYALEAFKDIRDISYYEWEMQWATRVNNPDALLAFQDVTDASYHEWELRWATRVNNRFARKAFLIVSDDSYYEWELRWSTFINTKRELRLLKKLRRRGSYSERELRSVAFRDGGERDI